MSISSRNNVNLAGREAGPVMVFAHGFGCDQTMWRYVAPAFRYADKPWYFATTRWDSVAAFARRTVPTSPSGAALTGLTARDSFRVGTAGTIFCTAQSLATDEALKSMFDAGYSVTCRDAALPVDARAALEIALAAAESARTGRTVTIGGTP